MRIQDINDNVAYLEDLCKRNRSDLSKEDLRNLSDIASRIKAGQLWENQGANQAAFDFLRDHEASPKTREMLREALGYQVFEGSTAKLVGDTLYVLSASCLERTLTAHDIHTGDRKEHSFTSHFVLHSTDQGRKMVLHNDQILIADGEDVWCYDPTKESPLDYVGNPVRQPIVSLGVNQESLIVALEQDIVFYDLETKQADFEKGISLGDPFKRNDMAVILEIARYTPMGYLVSIAPLKEDSSYAVYDSTDLNDLGSPRFGFNNPVVSMASYGHSMLMIVSPRPQVHDTTKLVIANEQSTMPRKLLDLGTDERYSVESSGQHVVLCGEGKTYLLLSDQVLNP